MMKPESDRLIYMFLVGPIMGVSGVSLSITHSVAGIILALAGASTIVSNFEQRKKMTSRGRKKFRWA